MRLMTFGCVRVAETVIPTLTAICTADVTTDEHTTREKKTTAPHMPEGKVGQACRFCQVKNLHVYF